jgi:ABC-2 type transport system ATP-binding protein
MICGLLTPTSGRATVADHPYRALPNPGRRVGVLLDAAAQHGGRTGREVLTLAALTIGVDAGRAPDLLHRVGLEPAAAKKRVRAYSLGMRQRLGLAVAMLGEPDILVLDEPVNGLDPEGIAWMRGLLRDFADRGGTVLLSSHLLAEVEAVADQFVMINSGRVVAAGAKAELLAGNGAVVRGPDADKLRAALTAAGLTPSLTGTGAFLVPATPEQVAAVAAAAGALVTELRPADGARLEQLFLTLTAAPASLEEATK